MIPDALALGFISRHPGDAARTLEPMEAGELGTFLAELPAREAASVMSHLLPQTAARCLSGLAAGTAAAIIDQLDADLAAMLLRRAELNARSAILAAVPAARAAALRLVIRFPDAVVGSVMDPEVPVVREDMLVKDAIAAIQVHGGRSTHYLFVIDRNKQLSGSVDFKKLLVADHDTPIHDLAQKPDYVFAARASLSSVRDHPAWQHLRSVPVVDRNGTFLGAVSRDCADEAVAFSGREVDGQEDITDFVFAFIETIWGACAELFVHGESGGTGRNKR